MRYALIYKLCQGNGHKSVMVYKKDILNRRVSNHQTFANIVTRLHESGSFHKVFQLLAIATEACKVQTKLMKI